MSEHVFGVQVANNHRLAARLRRGDSVTARTHDRIMLFIAENPPPERPPRKTHAEVVRAKARAAKKG